MPPSPESPRSRTRASDPAPTASGDGSGPGTTPTTEAATFCATVVDEWVLGGVTDAVVCPGSRSTPLALALAADDRVTVHVHHDERAGAFVALGLGMASGVPAVVLTTSGTAAVELHAAVVEAHHAKVPLLVCTADRPPELRDVGAPQAIDQVHLYGTAVRRFVDPGVPDAAGRAAWRSVAARALLDALGPPAGPVHLNLPFRDPLVGTPGPLPAARAEGGPWHGRPRLAAPPAPLDVDSLADAVTGRRGVIVAAGSVGAPDGIHALAEVLRWPVIADHRSGCRLPREATVSHADALLRVDGFASAHAPEVVLRLGALPASKVLGQWLDGLDAWQVGVEADGATFDPGRSLHALLEAEPSAFCEALTGAVRGARTVASPSPWYESWIRADAEAASAIREVLSAHPECTEPALARDVVAAIPRGGNLVVSSSMPVRDVEWYAAPAEGIAVLANRGANGIDGVVSTAVGVALGTGRPTAVLVGDVAFLHDTNALLSLASRPVDLTIVVVDNRGGGIFEFLPQATDVPRDRFERLFGTPHDVDLGALAGAHGLEVATIDAPADVLPQVRGALALGGGVLIARTDRAANVDVHRELHDAVARAAAPPT